MTTCAFGLQITMDRMEIVLKRVADEWEAEQYNKAKSFLDDLKVWPCLPSVTSAASRALRHQRLHLD